jgi:hypothetical protein
MKYTTHKLPTAEIDRNGKTSGQKFGEAGQELSLERGESIEDLQNDQDSSLNEIEQELLYHADGSVAELEKPASVTRDLTGDANPTNGKIDRAAHGSNSEMQKTDRVVN